MPGPIPFGSLRPTLRVLPGDVKALLGAVGSMVGIGAVSSLYARLVRGETSPKSEVRKIYEKIRKELGLRTPLTYAEPGTVAAKHAPYYMPEAGRSRSLLDLSPLNKGVHALSAVPGELAHELGHARAWRNPFVRALNKLQPMRSAANLATFPAAVFLSRPGVPVRAKAIGIAALSVPGVADVLDETIASTIGAGALYKFKRKTGSSVVGSAAKAMTTFVGLPTYALNAAFPAAAVGAGGFMRKMSAEDADPEEVPDCQGQSKEAYDYSSVQFNLPLNMGWQVWRWGQDNVDPGDVYTDPENPEEYGFSEEPHITLQYGFHNARSMYVAKRLKRQSPVVVQFGPTSLFHGKDYDVLKLEVWSPDLHALRPVAKKRLVVTETHPEYSPHVTIAYLKKGRGRKYVGERVLPEDPVVLKDVVFSSKNGTITRISLTEPRDSPAA